MRNTGRGWDDGKREKYLESERGAGRLGKKMDRVKDCWTGRERYRMSGINRRRESRWQ
jgi:hypothetical protein